MGHLVTPRMFFIYTTAKISIDFFVLNHSPAGYSHSLCAILERPECTLITPQPKSYRIFCPQSSAGRLQYPLWAILECQNAAYIHHSQHIHRIFCPQSSAGRLQTLFMGDVGTARMFRTNTTGKTFTNLLSSVIRRQVTDILCVRSWNIQNARYLHHNQNTHRIVFSYPPAGYRHTI